MYAKDPYLEFTAAEDHAGARASTTAWLRAASRALDALAERLTPVRRPRLADPVLEFYADAGAPEGALYIDGKLVGHVLGVTRL